MHLVVWDEAPLNHRHIFEVVDRTFRDVGQAIKPNAHTLPFGGLTVLLGGDFRKILPIITGEGREAIVGASISNSYLWQECIIFQLLQNMRIESDVPPVTVDGKLVHFKVWVLSIGNGLVPVFTLDDDVDPSWVQIPKEVHVTYSGDPIIAIVDEIYHDLPHNHGNTNYLRERAILTPLNEYVEKINREVLSRLPCTAHVYKSCDSICKGSATSDETLYPPKYFNTLRFSGMPNHKIEVKVGVPIMLLRNLNPKKGLYNGTRLIVTQCCPFLIEGLIITGNKIELVSKHQEVSASVVKKAFMATEEKFLSGVQDQWHTKPQLAAVGTCCLVGILCDGLLHVGNAKASRVVLGRADRSVN
ncbi:uncharacterized protein LOC141690263 [Apium graveolens]|uniref:uncharacterized protein LOC141690263 n=1 Tax=Apium graveolens TaxID=4045 RepID=UPI003D7A045C